MMKEEPECHPCSSFEVPPPLRKAVRITLSLSFALSSSPHLLECPFSYLTKRGSWTAGEFSKNVPWEVRGHQWRKGGCWGRLWPPQLIGMHLSGQRSSTGRSQLESHSSWWFLRVSPVLYFSPAVFSCSYADSHLGLNWRFCQPLPRGFRKLPTQPLQGRSPTRLLRVCTWSHWSLSWSLIG